MIAGCARALTALRHLAGNRRGSMAIETAIVAPVLVLLALGSFEISRMVARQHELQSGIAEAEAVALAANMGATTNTTALKAMLMSSLHLSADQVTVTMMFRCNDDATLSTASTVTACNGSNDVLSTYVRVNLKTSFKPIWTKLGVGSRLSYNVTRQVQLS